MGYRESDLNVGYFVAMDKKMRELLRQHLEPFKSGTDLVAAVELLRTTIDGIVLSAAEHPGKWPRQRVVATMEHVVRLPGLDVALEPSTRRR